MKTYERNLADQDVIVHSLKVLGSAEGGVFTEIRRSVEAVKKTISAQIKQQDEYWKALSADGVISTVEKQSLKREMENIRRSYSAVTTQATSLGYSNPLLQTYVDVYDDLRNYIYDTLKLFDDMTRESVIDDRDAFNDYFSTYYYWENFILLAITKGILDTIQIRVLTNLQETGTEGEVALYHGKIYQYTNGAWKSVSTGSYKGPMTELPSPEEDAFFIAADDFLMLDVLYVNEDELYVNGEQLGVMNYANKGYIYYCLNGVWYREDDKTNWRYAAAFADVLSITGELPEIFQVAIDDLQEQVTQIATSLADEIETRQNQYTIIDGDIVRIDETIYSLNSDVVANTQELASHAQDLLDQAAELRDQAAELEAQGSDVTDLLARAAALEAQAAAIEQELAGKISHLPEYFGASAIIPANPQEGDFFLYTGSTITVSGFEWRFANVYRFHDGSWQRLDSGDSAYSSYYMMALDDILANTKTTTGYFNTAFANAFFTNNATMDELSTRTIYLRRGGYIQSAKTSYSSHLHGLRIDSDGNIDANGDTHIGGTCTIDGTTTIGGNTTIGGVCNVDKLHFSQAYSPSATGFANGDIWLVES